METACVLPEAGLVSAVTAATLLIPEIAAQGNRLGVNRTQHGCPTCAESVRNRQHLLVSLHLPDEGALVEERLQPLLGVVVAELLEGGAPLLLGQPGVLETRSVHDQQGAERMLTGLQGSGEHKDG